MSVGRTGSVPALPAKGVPLTQHPDTHVVDVVCANCGSEFSVRSTASALAVDVCSNCHPAYTGAQRSVATGTRIERFNRRRALASARA
jgi:large subunit ribosomal protein L31